MVPALRLLIIGAIALLLGSPNAHASLIYLYDFPSGSGLASDQTNPQPSGATFSDFTRNTVVFNAQPGNVFDSKNWSTGGSLDPTVYEGFSITASGGFHLNLSSLAFTAYISNKGPANMEVGLFLNGSSTAYATFDFSPTTTSTAYTFNFTPLTDSDNVTTATFKFFGWNAEDGGGQLLLTNVGTYGSISSLPESSALQPTLLLLGFVFALKARQTRQSQQAS